MFHNDDRFAAVKFFHNFLGCFSDIHAPAGAFFVGSAHKIKGIIDEEFLLGDQRYAGALKELIHPLFADFFLVRRKGEAG